MKLDNNTIELICELEYLIGRECYNPKSYNGRTGDEGCSYRYPVYYYMSEEDEFESKTWRNIAQAEEEFTKLMISTMKYKFGSNHLFIGSGLYNVLSALEERYGIDFNKLEEGLQDNNV